jgi:hypothetical protein
MKSIKYLMMAMLCATLASCMNKDWDEPDLTIPPYGNNDIKETNVITIAELKSQYAKVISNSGNQLIEDDIQIKGRITGNDIGGNIYKQVALQDATGGIIIAVNQNGLNGYMPVGQEILVNLKGLHIGGYGKMAEIGAPYNGSSIGRMNKDIWLTHFKITGAIDASVYPPIEFSNSLDKDNDAVKLVVFKNVSFKEANGKNTFATTDATTNRNLNEFKVIVRTSNYADFAGDILPMGKVNLTGILTRFNNDWQLLIRTADDIQKVD